MAHPRWCTAPPGQAGRRLPSRSLAATDARRWRRCGKWAAAGLLRAGVPKHGQPAARGRAGPSRTLASSGEGWPFSVGQVVLCGVAAYPCGHLGGATIEFEGCRLVASLGAGLPLCPHLARPLSRRRWHSPCIACEGFVLVDDEVPWPGFGGRLRLRLDAADDRRGCSQQPRRAVAPPSIVCAVADAVHHRQRRRFQRWFLRLGGGLAPRSRCWLCSSLWHGAHAVEAQPEIRGLLWQHGR
mmetsp:Transcript_145433/g.466037  ORF Transcript_145433/g.466037 Transcript_145433/m.466037 type:complete len:241 (-) Transcript_145433:1103-1825(-)